MGEVYSFIPEKLIIGILCDGTTLPDELPGELEDEFGIIERIDGPFPFTYTEYYNAEMGPNIHKFFVTMHDMVKPDQLSNIKLISNEIEGRYKVTGNRRINLDPGILSETRFILATTKNRGHRIPLNKGIYGEVTLIYMNKNFQTMPWTYDDFSSEHYRQLLKEIRKKYLQELRRS